MEFHSHKLTFSFHYSSAFLGFAVNIDRLSEERKQRLFNLKVSQNYVVDSVKDLMYYCWI